ncbi:MAG: hypothetical protein GY861_18165 [bacterium]|nr:hypothetical protein [bacterium]
MNIAEVKVDYSKFKGRDMVEVMFEKQDELRLLYGVPICDIDVPGDQQQLRGMSWNVIEEASEAIDVILTTEHKEHLLDEVADLMSFYLELLLMSGLTFDKTNLETWRVQWSEKYDIQEISRCFMLFSTSLAISINSLKNRYWRKTNVKTDRTLFELRLKKTIPLFRDLLKSLDVSFDDVVDAYLRKHQVNLFRIKSKY